jgi:hypothetical protein
MYSIDIVFFFCGGWVGLNYLSFCCSLCVHIPKVLPSMLSTASHFVSYALPNIVLLEVI